MSKESPEVKEEGIEDRMAESLKRMAAQAKEKKDKEEADAKLVRVASAKANTLRPGIWYIALSTGKILPTRIKDHYTLALKMITAKTAVSYKEAKDTKDGKYWLAEIKAA